MKIDAYILCFNESKMIEHTLNYYSNFCDNITIIDNQSTDNSVNIVREKFPDVIVKELNTNGEYREDIQIEVRNNCWKESVADFVIMADMDEFIVDHDILKTLNKMLDRKVAFPKVKGFNMVSKKFPNDYSISILDQVVKGFRDNTFDKCILFSPKMIKNMNFGPGSHMCKPEFKEGYKLEDHNFQMNLLHFKYLGREYLYDKHGTYAKRMSDENRKYNYGFQYELGNKHVDEVFDQIEHFQVNK